MEVTDVVELLPIQTSSDRRFVDSAGRDVLLRGANVNSLGEYWQGVPGLGPTNPVTDEDWARMARHGISVVRLIVSWSRIEPTRGTIDGAYLDEVDAAVTAAAAHGIYTVIDMHQDAYTSTISTPAPGTCPSGTTPAKGWDGAPAWATITDGLSTCLTNGERNSSPAVNRAWNNFYDDVDGIRTEFAAMWGKVAARFAGRPEVAGYDLLNEPETSRPAADLEPLYDDLLGGVARQIRAAEDAAPFDHVLFVEPTVPAGNNANGIVIPDPAKAGVSSRNVSASVHNYSESIGGGSIEGLNDAIESLTAAKGVPNWGGEYGFWSTDAATLAKARRYAADEDAHRWGGAWWQWRQSCGDPHAVSWSNGTVVPGTGTSTHLNLLGCPDDTDLGPNEAFLRILGRSYPRATPGRLVELRSDPATGLMKVKATATKAGGTLVVWSPTADDADHPIDTYGLVDVESHPVDGGRIITAKVAVTGTYALWIGKADEDLTPTSTTTTVPAGGATPATPVSGAADYTG
ncbi:MAG: cellulase family glycosylhydrolase [Acidimicrobiales bacterium]